MFKNQVLAVKGVMPPTFCTTFPLQIVPENIDTPSSGISSLHLYFSLKTLRTANPLAFAISGHVLWGGCRLISGLASVLDY